MMMIIIEKYVKRRKKYRTHLHESIIYKICAMCRGNSWIFMFLVFSENSCETLNILSLIYDQKRGCYIFVN